MMNIDTLRIYSLWWSRKEKKEQYLILVEIIIDNTKETYIYIKIMSYGNNDDQAAERALQQARMQMAQQQTQMLVNSITAKCYEGCVKSPSSSLSKREETCLAMCFDKYVQTQQTIIKSMS